MCREDIFTISDGFYQSKIVLHCCEEHRIHLSVLARDSAYRKITTLDKILKNYETSNMS